jgi:hypothetical protein
MKKQNSKLYWVGLLLVALCLLLLKAPAKGQDAQKWYKITKNDAAIITLGSVSGIADGVNQNLTHWRWGKGKYFWDVKTSWKNKYKDFDNGNTDARFFGSKTIFVGFTDGYHLTRMIDRSAMLLSVGISAGELKGYEKKDRWKVIAKKILLSGISNRIAFNLIYK